MKNFYWIFWYKITQILDQEKHKLITLNHLENLHSEMKELSQDEIILKSTMINVLSTIDEYHSDAIEDIQGHGRRR